MQPFKNFAFIICFVFIANNALAQTTTNWQKFGLDNTQLYFFRLPAGVKNELLQAKVSNFKFKNLNEKIHLNGKLINRKNEFVYIPQKTNLLYGQKLPFYLPANTWVLAFNYSDQYLLIDNENKIQISLKKKAQKSNWQLPETFDMLAENALSFKQYLNSKADVIDTKYIPRLSLSEKTDPNKFLADTTLVFSLSKLPKGILLLENKLDLKAHVNQEINIETALLYKKEFFFYVQVTSAKIIVKNQQPDTCNGKMTDINGNMGYASGCLTGMGSGKCMGILKPNAAKKYNVAIIIEPN